MFAHIHYPFTLSTLYEFSFPSGIISVLFAELHFKFLADHVSWW